MSLEDQSSFTLGFQGFHTLFRPTSDNSARAIILLGHLMVRTLKVVMCV